MLLFLFLFSFLFTSLGAQPAVMPRVRAVLPRIVEQAAQQARLNNRFQKTTYSGSVLESDPDRWQYWSMGIGGGVGLIYAGSVDGNHTVFPWPDMRVGIERSWYLTDQFTATVDLALFTPTVRLGYLLDDKTRFSIGLGLWLLGSYGINLVRARVNEDSLLASSSRLAVKDARAVHTKNELMLTPSIALDHFVSRNCFVRAAASYDRIRLTIDKRQTFAVHWPQITVSLNFKF